MTLREGFMTYAKSRLYLLLMLVLAGLAACDTTTEPDPINEARVLVEYLEANRSYDVHGGFVISASDVRTNILTAPDDYLVLDIRAAADYAAGHIPGTINVGLTALPDYMAALSPAASTYDKVILVCYSGQSAAYATGILRAMGYENVFNMAWGMTAWHEDFAGPWIGAVSNIRATEFVTTASPAMNAPGELPELDTGYEDGASILEARAATVFAEGFDPAKITNAAVFMDLAGHYIINFWPENLYLAVGHIPGAINYQPADTPFLLDTDLTTLPTDQPVVIYCYTGQGSAYLAGYLRILGYDARSLLFGANGMVHDRMAENGIGSAFDPAAHVMNYDYEVSS
jgi:rhodanese-related sulfurtransferase